MPQKRILCADDNEDTCFMLSALLGREGYEVEWAGTTAEALSLAESKPFDLFVLDNVFPDGSGPELCRALRRLRPDTPVMFYSGAVFEADRDEALAAGARAYVAKPSVNRLLEAVRRLLVDGAADAGGASDDAQAADDL